MVVNLRGDPATIRLDGAKRPLAALAFSGAGHRLAGVADDRSIYIWDLATGKLDSSLETELAQTPPTQIASDHDGRQIAIVGADGTINVWDWEKKEKVIALRETDPVLCVAFNPTGRYLAYGGERGLLKVWDLKCGTQIAQLTGHQDQVLCLAFSPDREGKHLVSGGWDGTVRLWDVHTKRLLRTFEGQGSMITSVCFSPSGRRVASAAGRVVRLWDPMSGHHELTLQDQKTAVTGLSFCGPKGPILASVTSTGVIKTWDSTQLD
jgi:WD40 repeat protein